MALGTLGALSIVRQLLFALRVDDQASAGLRRASGAADEAGDSIATAARRVNVARVQIATLAVTATAAFSAMNVQFAQFNRQAGIASIAVGEGRGRVDEFSDLALEMSENLARSPDEMIQLAKAISFFGVRSQKAIGPIAEFSTRLAIVGEIDAPQAAQSIFRLAKITADADETAEQTAKRFESLAGAIFTAGTNITAGIPDLLKFVEVFAATGVVAENLSGEQIVALSAAIADLTPRFREIATTAALRIFATEEFEKLSQILGLSVEQVKRLKEDNPLVFFLRVLEAAKEASKDQRLVSFMKELNLGELRSIRGIASEMANLERLIGPGDDNILKLIEDPLQNINDLTDSSNMLLEDNMAAWDRLRAAFQRFTIAAGQGLSIVLVPLLNVLSGIVSILSNPAVASLLGFAAVAGVSALGGVILRKVGLGAFTAGALAKKGIGMGAGLFRRGAGAAAGGISAGRMAAGGFLATKASAATGAGHMRMGGFLENMARGVMGGAGGGAGFLGRAGAKLIPVVGQILFVVSAVSLLTTFFRSLGNVFEDLSRKGGFLGTVFGVIAFTFKVIESAGNMVMFIFDAIFDLVKFLAHATGLGKVFDATTGFFQGVNDDLDRFNREVSKRQEGNMFMPGAAGTQVNITTNQQFNVADGRDGLEAAFEQAAVDAVFRVGPRTVRTVTA